MNASSTKPHSSSPSANSIPDSAITETLSNNESQVNITPATMSETADSDSESGGWTDYYDSESDDESQPEFMSYPGAANPAHSWSPMGRTATADLAYAEMTLPHSAYTAPYRVFTWTPQSGLPPPSWLFEDASDILVIDNGGQAQQSPIYNEANCCQTRAPCSQLHAYHQHGAHVDINSMGGRNVVISDGGNTTNTVTYTVNDGHTTIRTTYSNLAGSSSVYSEHFVPDRNARYQYLQAAFRARHYLHTDDVGFRGRNSADNGWL